MSIAEGMIGEFSHEAVTTRKVLERVPEDKFDWKPHEKSMSLGQLAAHVAEIPEWTPAIVDQDLFDMDASDYKPKVFTSREDLLEYFDKNVELFKDRMAGQTDEHLFGTWKMKHGGEITLEMPRVACLRGFILSHQIHHRGQLTVYLRENDVPIPSIYGPSADESE